MVAPDWGQLIEQLVAAGVDDRSIGAAMSCILTSRMIRAYRLGAQPLHFRGDVLIELWCEKLGRDRADLPMAEVIRGHRCARPAARAPVASSLPTNWPPPSVKPIKRGRKEKP